MIVDSSGLLAIGRAEPDAARYAQTLTLQKRTARLLSVANYVETAIVVDAARDPVASRRLDQLLRAAGISVVAVSPEQGELARAAYRDFGKGSGHPARLNFGDCFAYALAKATDQPLLFKGDDFVRTDVAAVALAQ